MSKVVKSACFKKYAQQEALDSPLIGICIYCHPDFGRQRAPRWSCCLLWSIVNICLQQPSPP